MVKYNKYKDSGIAWIGEIPENWEVNNLKYLLKGGLKYGANEPAVEENRKEPRYLRITDFDDNENLRENTFKSLPLNIAKAYLLKEGDLLFARSGATVGKTFLFRNYKGKACYAGYLIKATPKKGLLDSKYLSLFTKSFCYTNWKESIFIQATIQNISAEKYNSLSIPLPPIKEQTQIANYLDNKTTAIDKKIRLLQQKIKHYKAYRKTLINETVTKGLDKTVKLKDSGINWIGEIPEHWDVRRYKSFGKTIKGKNMEMSDLEFDNSLPLLSLEYLRNDSVQHPTFCYSNDKSLKSTEEDLIIVWDGAAVGEILKSKVGYVSSTIAKLDINKKKFNTRYFYHLRGAIDYKLKQIPTGMGIPHLNPTLFKNFKCPSPPIQEQQQIADYLDAKTSTIDKIVKNIETQITTLKELRKTLINEVVTGKVKVSA